MVKGLEKTLFISTWRTSLFELFATYRLYIYIHMYIYIYVCIYIFAKSRQLCPTLCDPIDGSPPGSAVPGILQSRTLEWVASSFSNVWKWKVKVKLLSRVWLLVTPWTAAHQFFHPWDFLGKSTGVGCHCLLRVCVCVCVCVYIYIYIYIYVCMYLKLFCQKNTQINPKLRNIFKIIVLYTQNVKVETKPG